MFCLRRGEGRGEIIKVAGGAARILVAHWSRGTQGEGPCGGQALRAWKQRLFVVFQFKNHKSIAENMSTRGGFRETENKGNAKKIQFDL